MSLICGIVSRKDPGFASAAALQAMLDITRHRARDGQETFVDPTEGIALAYSHTATFGQPKDVPSWHQDDDVVAAVDGEIYDPSSHLEGRAASFKSSRASAVVASYETRPDSFPAALDGVFGLFLWDRQAKILHLSTSRFGQKLVYYYEDPERGLAVFSTELKGILAHPAVPRQLDERIIPLYLGVNLTPAPFTLVNGVRKMLAGERLSFTQTETKAESYWRPALESGPDDFDYWLSRTRSELPQAVKRTVGEAEKVGVYLSGGVDSAVVLAALTQSDVAEVQAFTLAYKGNATTYDLPWAERIASATGTKHQIVTIDPETDVTPELMSSLLGQIDEPFYSASRVVNEYFLGQASVAAGFDSIVTGATHNVNLSKVRKLRAANTSFETRTLEETLHEGLLVTSGNSSSLIRRMNDILVQQPDLTILQEASLGNRGVLENLDQIQVLQLDKALRSAQGFNSLFWQFVPPLYRFEERTPFLDTQMALLIFSVPAIFKGIESKDSEKALLRESFRDILRIDFSQREHEGFPRAPMPSWLNRMLIPSLKVLADDGIVTQQYLLWLGKRFQRGRKGAEKEAWKWFVFACWYQFQIKQTDPFAGIRGRA